MPTYATRQKRSKKKTRAYPKRLPRDPTNLFRWAARGSSKDYERLRAAARKARRSLPAHIDGVAFEKLMHIDRLEMIEQIQAAEQHNVSAGWFLDGLNWLLDKVPWGNWIWPVSAAQSSINAMKGDSLNEVDEQYARLVGATYGKVEDRPFVIDHWRRQVQFDSAYISVYDNLDGHRVICIRGTQGTATDIGEDILVGLFGRTTNLLDSELLQIIAASPQDMVIDLAAHSLGTSLALDSYRDSTIYNRIHETYLYSPAYSPFVRGSVDKYERDASVRYFINTRDAVSMGGLAHRAPKNVVFRSSGNPISAHKLAQWQGSSAYQDPIYHAPPETRVHAHKALFPKGLQIDDPENPQFTREELLSSSMLVKDAAPTVREDQGDPQFSVGDRTAPEAFDFGSDQPFDYARL